MVIQRSFSISKIGIPEPKPNKKVLSRYFFVPLLLLTNINLDLDMVVDYDRYIHKIKK